MPTVKVKNTEGREAGTATLSDAVFGVEPNEHCVRDALHHYMAANRSGTHATKTRGQVRGGGRKPWRQKGTGRARQGSIRAPQWRGGAIIFGPNPRDYSYGINRKVKRQAIRSVLAEQARSERLVVIEDFGLAEPKTRKMVELLEAVGAQGPTLIITENVDANVALSARNLPFVTVTTADSPNIYDLLTHDWIVATRAAVERMGEVFA